MIQSFVYFVRCPFNGRIKIGYAGSEPDRRFVQLTTGSPVGLEKMALMVGTADDEKQLHARFALLRWRGEWYEGGQELLDFIRENGRDWRGLVLEVRAAERARGEAEARRRNEEMSRAYLEFQKHASDCYMRGLDPYKVRPKGRRPPSSG